jgi:hypothetical protein
MDWHDGLRVYHAFVERGAFGEEVMIPGDGDADASADANADAERR